MYVPIYLFICWIINGVKKFSLTNKEQNATVYRGCSVNLYNKSTVFVWHFSDSVLDKKVGHYSNHTNFEYPLYVIRGKIKTIEERHVFIFLENNVNCFEFSVKKIKHISLINPIMEQYHSLGNLHIWSMEKLPRRKVFFFTWDPKQLEWLSWYEEFGKIKGILYFNCFRFGMIEFSFVKMFT